MPRTPLVIECRICGRIYSAKARHYKKTCSPRCALASQILNSINIAIGDRISEDEIYHTITNVLAHSWVSLTHFGVTWTKHTIFI